MRKDLERRMEDANKIEEDEEQEEKIDYSNMPRFVGELFKTFQKSGCILYEIRPGCHDARGGIFP